MASTTRKNLILIFVLILIVAFGSILWKDKLKQNRTVPVLKSGSLLPVATPIKPFILKGPGNKPFNNANLKGHWSWLFFGFTHCPVVCPTTLFTLNKTVQDLQAADDKYLPQVVFISVDPERDTMPLITQFLNKFSKGFIGATGPQKQLQSMTEQLGIMYAKVNISGEKNYMISHTAAVIVVNPDGKWVGILTPPFNDKVLMQDFQSMQRYYR